MPKIKYGDDVILKQFNLFNNLNIFLKRNKDAHPYNPKGRTQTEQEAEDVDKMILDMLQKFNLNYHVVSLTSDGSHINQILHLAKQRIEQS
jgi:hypothetical protein